MQSAVDNNLLKDVIEEFNAKEILAVNVDSFSRQVSAMAERLSELFRGDAVTSNLSPEHAASAFKELGVASEELQVAVEELQQQNEVLTATLELAALERKRYQDLFQFAPQAYLVTNLEGVIQEANRMAAHLLGVPTQFIMGKSLMPFVHEADRSAYWQQLGRRQQRDVFQEWQFRLQPRQQEAIDVSCAIMTVRDRTEQPIGFRWVLRNITEQKRLEVLERSAYLLDSESDAALVQHRPLHHYKSGDLIPLQSQALWYVVQGVVKLTSLTEQNRESLIGFVGARMPFGTYLTALPIYQAVALSDVQLVSVSLSEISASSYLAQLLLARTSQRLRQTETLVAILGEDRAEQKLWRLLQLLQTEAGQTTAQGRRLTVRLTHEELANACCCNRVTITRLLGKLERQGKIAFDAERHMILRA